jgi:glycosyltransferase involved in cell wall biosynthesis
LITKFKIALNILLHSLRNFFSNKKIFYVVERANWSIKHDGLSITKNLKFTSSITTTHYGIRNSIVHYGSINTFIHEIKGLRIPHKSNRVIVTWFHSAPNDSRIKYISEAIKYVDLWHTSCALTKKKLIQLGIPVNKIVQIPLGVNLNIFLPAKIKECLTLRKQFSIPDGKIVIGSYQKDGNGWEEGLEPKLVKGPDVFCDVVENLAKKKDIFVLLTGPARGYVKKRLEKAGIPYHHDFLNNPDEVASYYKVTDLYVVTSREEGGPKQILESMAGGVSVISTRVGMAPDVIIDGENGFIVEVEDAITLTQRAIQVLDNKNLRNNMIDEGLKTAQQYDWSIIAQQYEKNIYQILK